MLTQPLKHSSLLDELFFWAIKYELPQKLATFLLSLLPNDPFKVCIIYGINNLTVILWFIDVFFQIVLHYVKVSKKQMSDL